MSTQIVPSTSKADVVYPDSDGEPMAENTRQFRWIVTIKEGLDELFHDDPNVFVAGDLFWYPIEGDNAIRMAPDVMVVFGRPKGDRGSYMQWLEAGIAPQVVFEIVSPGNRPHEMARKTLFYEAHEVEEYYLYDPDENALGGWLRQGTRFTEIRNMSGWVSPRLGIQFELEADSLRLIARHGRPLSTYAEMARERREMERQRDEAARQRDEQRERAERLAAQLRALGVEPEA